MGRLTPAQVKLARHALGLGDGRKASYRNRFAASPGTPDHAEWMRMYRKGAANYRSARAVGGSLDLFWLTTDCAEAVLLPGETLDPEDFPAIALKDAPK